MGLDGASERDQGITCDPEQVFTSSDMIMLSFRLTLELSAGLGAVERLELRRGHVLDLGPDPVVPPEVVQPPRLQSPCAESGSGADCNTSSTSCESNLFFILEQFY